MDRENRSCIFLWGIITFMGICFVLSQNNKHQKEIIEKLDKLITVAQKY